MNDDHNETKIDILKDKKKKKIIWKKLFISLGVLSLFSSIIIGVTFSIKKIKNN